MAEGQEKTDLANLTPEQIENLPYEQRFLSTEKQYPTKEARAQALEELRNPQPKSAPKPTQEYDFIKEQKRYFAANKPWLNRVLERHRTEVAARTPVSPPPSPVNETPKEGLFQRFKKAIFGK